VLYWDRRQQHRAISAKEKAFLRTCASTNCGAKRHSIHGFMSGLFFAIFGGLLVIFSLLRLFFVSDDWLNIIGLVFGIVFIPLVFT